MQITDALPDPALPLPLSQHPFQAAALRAAGRRAEVLTLRNGPRRVGQVLLVQAQLPVLGPLAMTARGPHWAPGITVADRIAGLRSLSRQGLRMVDATAGDSDALRACGFRQITTPAHLAVLDIAGSPQERRARTHGKWRNRMAAAERAGLEVHSTRFTGDARHWLLAADAAQRRRKRYKGLPVALTIAFAQANPGMARLFTAKRDGVPIAAMLFLRHGPVATYQIGWTGPEGRAHSAHHLLLMHAADWLADHGHCCIDLGSVDTEAAPGLARFKIGSGARVQALGGSWLRLWSAG